MLVIIPSFLHNSLHPSICELPYAIPFLSHHILIMHILAPPFMLSTAFFSLLLIYHNLPFPPSHLMLPFVNHITPPMSLSLHSSIYASHCTITHAHFSMLFYLYISLWPHQACTCHYSPLKCSCPRRITSLYVCISLNPALLGLTTNEQKQTGKYVT